MTNSTVTEDVTIVTVNDDPSEATMALKTTSEAETVTVEGDTLDSNNSCNVVSDEEERDDGIVVVDDNDDDAVSCSSGNSFLADMDMFAPMGGTSTPTFLQDNIHYTFVESTTPPPAGPPPSLPIFEEPQSAAANEGVATETRHQSSLPRPSTVEETGMSNDGQEKNEDQLTPTKTPKDKEDETEEDDLTLPNTPSSTDSELLVEFPREEAEGEEHEQQKEDTQQSPVKQEEDTTSATTANAATEEEPPSEDQTDPNTTTTKKTSGNTIVDTVRKGAVAVAGGTLTAVGLVMIPLPTPMGCVVAGSGMALLGTEFEAANRVMQQVQESAEAGRDKLIEHIESTIEDDRLEEKDEIVITTNKKKTVSSSRATELQQQPTEVTACSSIEVCPRQKQQPSDREESTNHITSNSNNNSNDTAAPLDPSPTSNDTATQQQQTSLQPPNEEEESTEMIISVVNADVYFEEETNDRRKRNGHKPAPPLEPNNHQNSKSMLSSFLYQPLQSARQKIGVETRGFLATSVLPLLHKTKQQQVNVDGNAVQNNNNGSSANGNNNKK